MHREFFYIFALNMKSTFYILISLIIVLAACKKDDDARTSGTDTINNKTYQSTTYYVYGFSFSKAEQVPTTLNPGPDIIVYVNQDNLVYRLTLQANNLYPSFYKVGDYANEAAAKAAFDNIKTFTVSQWSDMADPISPNQVWIYRSGDETFTKFRIISTISEIRQNIPYGECTFEWIHQQDGTATFP